MSWTEKTLPQGERERTLMVVDRKRSESVFYGGVIAAVVPGLYLRDEGSVIPVKEYPVSIVLSCRGPLRNYIIGISRPDRKTVTWAMVNAEPEFDDTGEITRVIVSFVNITERKRAELEQKIRAAAA